VDVVVHTCNTSTWEAEAEGWQIQSQPGLCSKTVSKKLNKNQKSKQKNKVSRSAFLDSIYKES
jgi:hypothetical protein